MRKGKKPKRQIVATGDWRGRNFDVRAYRTAYECDCGWRCQRNGGGISRIVQCPVCRKPKEMMAVAAYNA